MLKEIKKLFLESLKDLEKEGIIDVEYSFIFDDINDIHMVNIPYTGTCLDIDINDMCVEVVISSTSGSCSFLKERYKPEEILKDVNFFNNFKNKVREKAMELRDDSKFPSEIIF